MNNKNTGNCATCKEGWSNFKVLGKDEFVLVENNRFEASFKAGEIIFKQGSPASNVVFLRSGLAKVYVEGQGDRNLILNLIKPGFMLVGPGIYTDNRHSFTASALNDVRACFISSEIIRQLVRQNGEFAEGLLREVSYKSQINLKRLLSLSQKKMPGRVAEVLLYLSEVIHKSDEFRLILSRQEMADMAGLAKESIVRILKDFANEGIIYSDNPDIRIIDKERLKLISLNG